jgi:chitosanase
MAIAAEHGLRLPLTLVALYDTAIQHGIGDDPDGLPAIVAEATAAGPDPAASGADEVAWLRSFLEIRRRHLEHAADPETRKAWQESSGRVDTLEELLAADNLAFAPTAVEVYGDHFDLS